MVENNKKAGFVKWANNQEAISLLVFTGERINNAVVKNDDAVYEWILAIDFSKLQPDSVNWDDLGLGRILQASHFDKDGRPFTRLFFEDRSRFDLCFVSEEDLDRILEKDSLCEIVLDRSNRYGATKKPTDLSRRIKKPTEEEFSAWCGIFFTEMTDVCLYLKNQQLLPAQVSLGRTKEALMNMVKASTSAKSEYTLNPGKDVQNLKAYLDEEATDLLDMSFAKTTDRDLWDAVFKSCILFRRMGLDLAERTGYPYPKEIDVNLLKVFRSIWEESR